MDKPLQKALLAMKRQDDKVRTQLVEKGELYHQYHDDMRQVHRSNAERLDKIIDSYGWPGVSLVGEEGAYAAWTVAQHAIDFPALQRKFLVKLNESVTRGDAPQRQLAFLMDRVRFNQGQPQMYGTVLDWNERGQLQADLEDPERVDEFRQLAGLGSSYAESVQKQAEVVAAEGGEPPADFAAYKQRQQQWAQEAGWHA